jgi:hypothetical protein
MAQQTAVSWLAEELKSKGHALITSEGIFVDVPDELLEEAKQMEKEQIMDAYWNGTVDIDKKDALIEAEIFYKETYNK